MWMMLLAAAGWAAPPTVSVDLEWRAMYMAQHVSHGPGFALNVGVLNDHLRIGFSGFARPGPINPQTFDLPVVDGYNGKSSLRLRSDGSIMGVNLSPGFDTKAVRIDFPLMVGFGGFGFYLVGEDRRTPDGRLPSAWEDELMDGRDSSLGLGLEGGVRVTFRASDHAQPYLAFRWTSVVGYDAALATSYGGPSLALGVTVGRLKPR